MRSLRRTKSARQRRHQASYVETGVDADSGETTVPLMYKSAVHQPRPQNEARHHAGINMMLYYKSVNVSRGSTAETLALV